mmetsp:Transcript_24743/g.30162  ORF Transcript_24743/g.30162 Transcript_24743/m.30162 type:complete len:309 (-) Transcript_24743:115-1041(-)
MIRRVVGVSGSVVGFIFGIYITFAKCAHMRDVHIYFRSIFYIAILCYWMSIILQTIHIFYYELYGVNEVTIISGIITTVTYTGLIFTYLGATHGRLKYTFIGTTYEPSKIKIKLSEISIYIMSIIGIPGSILSAVGQEGNTMILKILAFVGLVATPLAMLMYVIISAILLYMFVNRMRKLTNDSERIACNSNSNVAQLKNRLNLLSMVVRYNVLSTIKYLSTLLFLIIFVVSVLYSHIILINMLWDIIFYFDTILNIICLYLQYNIGTQHYNKFCFLCDKCCKSKGIHGKLNMQLQVLNSNTSTPVEV